MGAVLVHIDCDGDRPHPSSLKALHAARIVATSWGASLYAAIIVHNPAEGGAPDSTSRLVSASTAFTPAAKRRTQITEQGVPTTTATPPTGTAIPRASASSAHDLGAKTGSLANRIGLGGADKLVCVIVDTPVAPLWASVGGAWQQVLDHLRPRLVLFGADAPSAADLGPRTGARIGARMLLRARPVGTDLVELRDRDGGYVRAADSGAAVALIGSSPQPLAGDPSIECILLVAPNCADERVELVGTVAAELAHTDATIVAIGDDLLGDAAALAKARELAELLDAHVVGSAAAARDGAIAPGAVVERGTPLAPELCIALGNASVDLAGHASLVRIGTGGGKGVDGALVGPVAPQLAELVDKLAALGGTS